jgi:GNAT superfamily N-acetyltransferase
LFTANRLETYNLSLLDLPQILRMAECEFGPRCRSVAQVWDLRREILELFLPKLLVPPLLGHHLRGVKTSDGKLIAFVDVSLQPATGTLDALKPTTLKKREKSFGQLEPYLCNLLVDKDHRGQGLGKHLIKECEAVARNLGHTTINLHVEASPPGAALKLYVKSNFRPIRRVNKNVLFMKRKLE